jgi:RND family efflux transporter MFP subunit
MKKFFKLVLPAVVLAVSLAVGVTLIRTAPKAERRLPAPVLPTVEIMTVRPSNYPVIINSQGTVVPRTQSTLIPEVNGQIVRASENFQAGGFFEAGEILLEIDPRDYINAKVVAEAALAQADAALDEERARGTQALRDWEVLKLSEEPNDLALRKPQLKSAQAAVAAATARLEQASINLQRTNIQAPYTGLVLEKQVDVGQYVSPGNVLARIYAVDLVEIRLPLTNHQLAYLNLPEPYRGQTQSTAKKRFPLVYLTTQAGSRTHRWKGRVVRTAGAIDTQSQQIFVIAQVNDPYGRQHGLPLKVGQFVEAQIAGRVLIGVFVLPRGVIRANNEVLVVGRDDIIERRQVEVIWSDNGQAVVKSGLRAGERISLTSLPYAISGTRVRVADEHSQPPAG